MYPSLTWYPGLQNLEKLWKPHAWRIQAFPQMTKETLTKGPVTRKSVSRNVCTALSSVNLWCINLCTFCLGCILMIIGVVCRSYMYWTHPMAKFTAVVLTSMQWFLSIQQMSIPCVWMLCDPTLCMAQGVYYCISNIECMISLWKQIWYPRASCRLIP